MAGDTPRDGPTVISPRGFFLLVFLLSVPFWILEGRTAFRGMPPLLWGSYTFNHP